MFKKLFSLFTARSDKVSMTREEAAAWICNHNSTEPPLTITNICNHGAISKDVCYECFLYLPYVIENDCAACTRSGK